MEIKEVKFFTNNISRQKYFYSKVLELEEIKSLSEEEISYKIGSSILTFIKVDRTKPYHFAINIYSNQEQEALTWLKERVPVLKNGKEEIQNFESWNAKSIYFYDEEKNIVEFIARKNLKENSREVFDSKSLLEISEIGLPTNNIEAAYKKLNSQTDISIYSGSFEDFCAIGNERGLIICVNPIKKKWFPTNDQAFVSDFKSEIVNKNKAFIMNYRKGNLTITPK